MTSAAPHWPCNSPERFVDDLLAWIADAGAHRYDESVSQVEHALQCAWLATRAKDSDAAVAAALLHDVGHLLEPGHDGDGARAGTDLEHEVVGSRWLERAFPATVTGPIRGHVAAKRYLCSVEPAYRARLSPGSERSLQLQGGLLSSPEVAQMEVDPGLRAAVALRRRDDAAKVCGREVPGLECYRDLLVRVLRSPARE